MNDSSLLRAKMLYEVKIEVHRTALARLDAYMTGKHIREVMATGCFLGARYSGDGDRRRTVYEAADQVMLDRYLNIHAERLRADFKDHFPEGVAVAREIWRVIAAY